MTFPFALYVNAYSLSSPVYVGEGESDLTYHEKKDDQSTGYMECGPITIKQIGP